MARVKTNSNDRPLKPVKIVKCGQLIKKSELVKKLEAKAEASDEKEQGPAQPIKKDLPKKVVKEVVREPVDVSSLDEDSDAAPVKREEADDSDSDDHKDADKEALREIIRKEKLEAL